MESNSDKLVIFDTTLRDGEQSPGASMNVSEKLRIAKILEKLNVDFKFEDEVLFTDDLQKAQELDIDFTEDEINLEELIWELVLVSIPYNYSESEKIVEAIKQCNGGELLKYTPWQGANHGALEKAFRSDALYDWLFQFSKTFPDL